MLEEVISSLNLKEGKTIVDATVGGGGHAREILGRITPGGRLIGLDADEAALEKTRAVLKDFEGSFTLLHDNFRHLDSGLSKEGVKKVDGIIFDCGISSYQIEEGDRGFSIKYEARLDMRMDKRLTLTAFDIVNKFKEDKLSDIIKKFGEERFHRKIAGRIAEARVKKPIETTYELASLIRRTVGFRGGRIDPATRTFQALRIAVNDELGALEEGVKQAVSWLKAGGRICVISFHSLEDRIVKHLFKGYSALGIVRIITKKPMRPSPLEVMMNPRSRSAKLRVAERVE